MGVQTHILAFSEIDPKTWNAFIYASPQASPFVLYEYMSIIKKEWEAVIVEEKGIWKAVMPIAYSRKWTFSAILQPLFAQYWGICFAPFNDAMVYKNYSQQKKYGSAIIEAIDHAHVFAVNFSPSFNYPLPFHWNNYELKTKYTYRLSLTPDENTLFSQLASPLKRQIAKARRNKLTFVEYQNIDPLFELIHENKKNGKSVLGTAMNALGTLESLAYEMVENGSGKIYGIVDEQKRNLATGLFINFLDKTYYLQGVYTPKDRNSGAMSLLMWEAILKAKTTGHTLFDFEGSMIMGIEAFFRKFGAEAVSYLHIYRNQLPKLIKWIQELR